MQTAPTPLKVVRASGCELELADGRQLLDLISSWWVTLHGHARPEIAQAIAAQAAEMEQVIFAGFTHEPAQQVARQVVELLPPDLTCAFFSDNGSTSVEVALKMALQYFHNLGKIGRRRFIGFQGGYHGDTTGAMSIGGSSPFWQAYRPAMFEIDLVEFPDTFDGDTSIEEKEARALDQLRTLLEKAGDDHPYAAICIEPLIQGAAGMRMCRPQFLQKLEKTARAYDVLLIFDEVMTGFGRTGELFACRKSGTSPDIICLSKGITGGFLPLALTVASRRIYDSFLSEHLERAFFHSHSYTANPIACAAACASLSILQREQARFQDMERRHRNFAQLHLAGMFESGGRLQQPRFCGTIAAFDLATPDNQSGYFNQVGPALRQQFLEMGLLLRPLGNTIYLLPPFCIDDEQLERAYKGIALAVANL